MSQQEFEDHFSGHAADYARFRPTYPDALFDFVAAQASQRELAWDCATGNGQAALALAERFESVIATDASAEQLEHAPTHRRIEYRRAVAEQSGLADGSVDLIAVATADHWFDLDRFYAEVRRVARPGAIVALWTYMPNIHVSPEVDRVVETFAFETLAPHWSPRLFRYAREGYTILPFPFETLSAPDFGCSAVWDADSLCQYLGTWSAVQAYRRAHRRDPISEIADEIRTHWGAPSEKREVKFSLHVKVGRVGSSGAART